MKYKYLLIDECGDIRGTNKITEEDLKLSTEGLHTIIDVTTMEAHNGLVWDSIESLDPADSDPPLWE